jgi:hypothetical protein
MKKARMLRDVTAVESLGDIDPADVGLAPDQVLYEAGKTYIMGGCSNNSVYLEDYSDFWWPPEDSYEVTEVKLKARFNRDVLAEELVRNPDLEGWKKGQVIYAAGKLYAFDPTDDSAWLEDGSDFYYMPEGSYEVIEETVTRVTETE